MISALALADLVGNWAKIMAVKTRAQPISSRLDRRSPRMLKPAKSEKTASRLIIMDATTGLTCF